MISVEEASGIVLENTLIPRIVTKSIEDVLGKTLQEDVLADRDFPPFDRVMMDGIAINLESFRSGSKQFEVEAIQTAGSPQLTLHDHAKCIEVMTGSMLPVGTNAVIRYEDVVIQEGVATITISDIKDFQNIHPIGSDQKKGAVLISKGTVIEAPEISILATVGKSKVAVCEDFKFAIISTGDELVDVDQIPEVYQIRKSNVYALQAGLSKMGFDASLFHIKDDLPEIRKELKHILDEHDVVLLSGGVSMGKRDYIPQVLDELDIQKLFHKVKQRPGKPFWFGKNEETVVFALPGNPVSTFMCFHRYVKPWIYNSLGHFPEPVMASLSQDFEFAPEVTYFLQVKSAVSSEGYLIATPVKGQGSGDLANLLTADSFLELPAGRNAFKKGETFPLHRYR